MTRLEHLQFCKDRAIQEYDYYAKNNLKDAIRNGITSIMSDINKHPETNSELLQQLCLFQIMGNMIHNRQDFVKFISGFN